MFEFRATNSRTDLTLGLFVIICFSPPIICGRDLSALAAEPTTPIVAHKLVDLRQIDAIKLSAGLSESVGKRVIIQGELGPGAKDYQEIVLSGRWSVRIPEDTEEAFIGVRMTNSQQLFTTAALEIEGVLRFRDAWSQSEPRGKGRLPARFKDVAHYYLEDSLVRKVVLARSPESAPDVPNAEGSKK